MENSNRNQIISASSLEGTDVRTPTGENIGDIKDIMIDLSSGEVSYVVLSVSTGFLNLESKYFAVPLGAFGMDNLGASYHNDNYLELDVSKERLENSPGFDKDNWPQHPDSTFVDSVNTYYGMEGRNQSYRSGDSNESYLDEARSSDHNLDNTILDRQDREDRRRDNTGLF